MKTDASALNTPMLKQYQHIKDQHPDSILFFRLGDFYEMFMQDAITASKILELTLTGRGKDENRVPMCGVPYHAANGYITKLVQKGYKVALCEQLDGLDTDHGITQRDVVKIITPATAIDQDVISVKRHNFLAALHEENHKIGIALSDCATGDFFVSHFTNNQEAKQFLQQFYYTELLSPSDIHWLQGPKTQVPFLSIKEAENTLKHFFKIDCVSAFGIKDIPEVFPAAMAIIDYLKYTQKNDVSQLTKIKKLSYSEFMKLDPMTIQHLDLLKNKQHSQATLLGVLDETCTPMGARHLSRLLQHPLLDPQKINHRLDAVEELKNQPILREEMANVLKSVDDIQRLSTRIVSGNPNPRDCMALKQSLLNLHQLNPLMSFQTGILSQIQRRLISYLHPDHALQTLIKRIDAALIENPPAIIRDGGMIKPGYSPELDELMASFQEIKHWILSLEQRERERTGIKSLKVGFTKVFGYYIEIPNSHKDKIPENYHRKQTLVGAERYITAELKEKENILLNGEENQKKIEIRLYQELVELIRREIGHIQALSDEVAALDVFQSLGTVAQKNQYTRPVIQKSQVPFLTINNGKHPVLAQKMTLIANSITLNEDHFFMLITGPNMAGKSTLMRQVGLMVIMAQLGSFVPADYCELSPVDQLFTRIGASDNLYDGQSTFMMEMLETANILKNASSKSLILLDEIGRGTSTFDGISIAGAICDYMTKNIQARTLFATHYHELTVLEKKCKGFFNTSMGIREENKTLVFTYQLIKGPADKSYGIHVAEIAGLPESVIQEAKNLLEGFESQGIGYLKNSIQLSLF